VSVVSNQQHPALTVERYGGYHKKRTLWHIAGVGVENTLGVFNPDIDTLACSLLERMYYCKVGEVYLPAPDVDMHYTSSTLASFRTKLLQFVPGSRPALAHEFVETYRGRKRTIYENALRDMSAGGARREDAISIAFVKVEKGNVKKAPRCIQPRKPAYNISLGCYVKPIEKKCYRAIRQVFGGLPVVMKGYNLQSSAKIIAAKWSRFISPVAVGLDATKFDMHVSPAMLAWEHSIYMSIYRGDSRLRELLSWQMHNKGVGFAKNGRLRYSVQGKRFSGDMNTALGNCIVMCGMVYTYLLERGITKYEVINNGDDCVVIMETFDLQVFQHDLHSWFLRLGFRMTVEAPVYVLEQLEFCQMRCISTVNGPIMVRNLFASMSKDTLCVLDLSRGKSALKWFHAVGECGEAITRGVPVVSAFYRMYSRWGRGQVSKMRDSNLFMDSGFYHLSAGVHLDSDEITPESRLSYYLAWGVTPDEQLMLERHFDTLIYGGECENDYGSVMGVLMTPLIQHVR